MALRGWLVLAMALMATPAAGCGVATDCVVGDRTYRIAVPDGAGPFGAILYLHGYQGSAAAVMGASELRAVADTLGVALIAPKSADAGWLIRNAPRRALADSAIELDGIDAMLADAAERSDIDPGRVLVAGFSGGGMMTWTLACRRADRFIGFVPIAGTFWAPLPRDCDGAPANILHVHGTADAVVPLAGRPIADTRQGDVHETLAMFREALGAGPPMPVDGPDGLDCEGSLTERGGRLLLCLHGGGHDVRASWIAWAWHAFGGD